MTLLVFIAIWDWIDEILWEEDYLPSCQTPISQFLKVDIS